MQHKAFILFVLMGGFWVNAMAESGQDLQHQVQQLQLQTRLLQEQLNSLQLQLVKQNVPSKQQPRLKKAAKAPKVLQRPTTTPVKKAPVIAPKPIPANVHVNPVHTSPVTVNRLDNQPPNAMEFYPTALIADNQVVTYIAGTPIVTSPYLGSRPAFDGSDYIVNISSINRDVRMMEQRRRLYRAYESIGYPVPHKPIIALSGKVEPLAVLGGGAFFDHATGDVSIGASELDVGAMLNDKVEAYMALAVDASPPDVGGQRLSNSSIDLAMGFVNIGDLDKTPLYFTGGQMFVPFGRFSTSMVSAPLTMMLGRTKSRPFILGYKSQQNAGPFAAFYGFRSDTTLGSAGVGGINLGYVFDAKGLTGEVGVSGISALNDTGGMQFNGSTPGINVGTFGGFSSPTNGNEDVHKVPALDLHASLSVDRYNFIAEWVGAVASFRQQDLSFNDRAARPQAAQIESSVTFRAFDKPASFGLGYQWSKDTLALNLPKQRVSGVFNISVWKDTVESLEFRHDINYPTTTYANGAAPIGQVNAPTFGPGGASETLLAQIGVYF
jgi:hypothetical protein